ncbi:hypothetical protein F5Y13DRAFT_157562 [Hypoxylon sp. FL1857]|nr:hypothetical protein F5Y13DRAFT_157562 [Hypoxylon sp. FL1857]
MKLYRLPFKFKHKRTDACLPCVLATLLSLQLVQTNFIPYLSQPAVFNNKYPSHRLLLFLCILIEAIIAQSHTLIAMIILHS